MKMNCISVEQTNNCSVTTISTDKALLVSSMILDAAAPQTHSAFNKSFETDQTGVLASFRLLLPAPDASGLMAIYQHKNWWVRPAFAAGFDALPERTQLILWKQDKVFSALLAVCDCRFRADFSAAEGGVLVELSTNGCALEGTGVVAAFGQGADPYALIHDLVAAVAQHQGRSHILCENKVFPEMFRHLGWCTWDSFYHKVNEADIFRKLDELRAKQIPIHWMLIDDGWSDADYTTRKLNAYTADVVKFPHGLAHTVRRAKEEYGLTQVGVWHALLGYWTGMNPGSEIFRQLEGKLVRKDENDYVLKPDEDVIYDFYDRWHTFLAESGVDFVKVDSQGSASIYYKGDASYDACAGRYFRALERSVDAHFSGNLVNCMGMAPENMWLREHSALSRSSDDFVPMELHSFREHAKQNGYNSLLQGQFYWGDWDMFWSNHVENKQSSVLRAVSGGPVYVSDKLDMSDASYILPLVGWDERLPLCDGIGVPTMDCLLRDPLTAGGLFKLFNTVGDGFVVAAFNIYGEEKRCSDQLTVADIPGLAGKEWLVYRHFAGTVEELSASHAVALTLDADDAEFLLVLPKRENGQFLGDPSKYLSTYNVLEESSRAGALSGTVAACQTLRFVTPRPATRATVDGVEVALRQVGDVGEISCPGQCQVHVEILY